MCKEDNCWFSHTLLCGCAIIGALTLQGAGLPKSLCMLSWPWLKLRVRKSLILAYLLAISVVSLLSGAAVLMNSGLQRQADSTPQHMIEVFPRFVHRPNFTEIYILIQTSRPSLNLSDKTLRSLSSHSHVRVGFGFRKLHQCHKY